MVASALASKTLDAAWEVFSRSAHPAGRYILYAFVLLFFVLPSLSERTTARSE